MIWLIPLLALMSFPAFAQDVPLPAQHPAHQLEKDKEEAQNRKESLQKEAKELQKDLEKDQKNLVALAEKVQAAEKKLLELNKRIEDGKAESEEIEQRLRKDRGNLGTLVLALERLNRTPPEALLARPGAPLETAQSAMLLQRILPDIYARAENLRKDAQRLSDLLSSLEKDRAAYQSTMAGLLKEQKNLSIFLDARKLRIRNANSGIAAEERALRQIADQSENLKDLVAKLEEERTAPVQEVATTGKVHDVPVERPRRATPPVPREGAARLPISGSITVGYKQMDDIGAESQGLTLEGRAGSVVVSPMGGVVQYAGTFKNYGRILIVEHQKDYHSLIAGLARIDTVVGQSVAAGEPIGALSGSASSGGTATLYYELRQNGEPVNPSRKFSGL
jgi:murein hydrolase activator